MLHQSYESKEIDQWTMYKTKKRIRTEFPKLYNE